MDYEQIISNLKEVLFNQSRMLIECETRIKELEKIVGVYKEIPDEITYGYVDTVENDRIVHGDQIANKNISQIIIKSNNKNKITLFTSQLYSLKYLKSIEFQFDRGYSPNLEIHLADKIELDTQQDNVVSAAQFRKFCFERGISVSFYDKNRGFYPDWDTLFS
jgi:hypothetical protein